MRTVVVVAIATFILSLTTPILVEAYSLGTPYSTTLQQTIIHASSSFQRRNKNSCLLAFLENSQEEKEEGIRLNKVFKATHSRRAADALILSGRVTVNGVAVENKGGFKVVPFVDEVSLDGKLVKGWEAFSGFVVAAPPPREGSTTNTEQPQKRGQQQPEAVVAQINTDSFEYVKYWKPRGVTCTTDRSIRDNIIDAIMDDGYRPRHRVYPVGRLDKDTSGLILLTSDGRLPNSVLRGKYKQPKIYEVRVDQRIRDSDIDHLREGVVITTIAQRDNNVRKTLTAKTLPTQVERLGPQTIRITLVEGRNRQIRKMLGALDYAVVDLQRVSFLGMTLDSNLKGPGDWMELADNELRLIREALEQAQNNNDDPGIVE